jgi:hypothetical protein
MTAKRPSMETRPEFIDALDSAMHQVGNVPNEFPVD